jgi:hypothetical protein
MGVIGESAGSAIAGHAGGAVSAPGTGVVSAGTANPGTSGAALAPAGSLRQEPRVPITTD